jgi:hypothetical protein
MILFGRSASNLESAAGINLKVYLDDTPTWLRALTAHIGNSFEEDVSLARLCIGNWPR